MNEELEESHDSYKPEDAGESLGGLELTVGEEEEEQDKANDHGEELEGGRGGKRREN